MTSFEPLISSAVSMSLSVALEGLEQGAVDAGLTTDDARTFARQALLGTVMLMDDLEESPAALKDRVASPGGTTIAGLAALEDKGVRGVMIRALECAVEDGGEGRHS